MGGSGTLYLLGLMFFALTFATQYVLWSRRANTSSSRAYRTVERTAATDISMFTMVTSGLAGYACFALAIPLTASLTTHFFLGFVTAVVVNIVAGLIAFTVR